MHHSHQVLNHNQHHHVYDHHTDFTNQLNKYNVAQRPQSSEQSSSASSSSSSSSSGEHQEFLPRTPEHHSRPEHQFRDSPANSNHEHTKLFSPYQSETPYSQQHQLHHQQQYAQLRRQLLTRERMRSSSEESEADSTEFRPMMSSQSAEYMSPSSNVETVVPPPPNQQTRSSFHINVPERGNNMPNENEPEKEGTTSSSGHINNQFTHNIEIPVHFYRLQPLENGEGFAITS